MNKPTGGPAYPVPSNSTYNTPITGLTIRDHFAGLAMQAIVADDLRMDESVAIIAEAAYTIADFMIAERSKPCTTNSTPK